MNDNDKNDTEEQLELGPQDSWERRDPSFDDFDAEEEFEESDRDSDFAAVFTEVEEEEPDLPLDDSTQGPLDTVDESPWEDSDDEASEDSWNETGDDREEEATSFTDDTWAPLSPSEATNESFEPDVENTPPLIPESEEPWEEEYYEEENREISLPLGMIVVGIVALVLLGAGGFGVMQDRAAMQEEIRQLQASLATTASPGEVAESRADSETLSARNRELEQEVADLSRENRSLEAIVTGLETQLQAQQDALNSEPKTVTPVKAAPAAPKPKPEPKPKPVAPATPPTADTWFVNFGSYGQRAAAEAWAKRLKPDAGNVIVATGEKDGRTFYRVRVINLESRDVAESTARKLEQEYELSRLWVGRAG